MEKLTHKNHFKLFSAKIMLSCMVLVMTIPLVSALSTGESIIGVGIIFTILITAGFFLYISHLSENVAFKTFFLFLSALTLIVSIMIGIIELQEYMSNFNELISSYSTFFWVFAFLFFLATILLLLKIIKDSLDLFKKNKGLRT